MNTPARKPRFDTQAAAEYLYCSVSLLNKLRCQGKGPRYIKRGGRVWYTQEDLDAYDAASVVETTDSRKLAAQASA